jgi:hypothetical protein
VEYHIDPAPNDRKVSQLWVILVFLETLAEVGGEPLCPYFDWTCFGANYQMSWLNVDRSIESFASSPYEVFVEDGYAEDFAYLIDHGVAFC